VADELSEQLTSPSPFAKPGPYLTKLPPDEEKKFQIWVQSNKIPWTESPTSNYDMRGFFRDTKAMAERETRVKSGGSAHFPDTYKTPYHRYFSKESRYATEEAPHWEGDRLVDKSGKLIVDQTQRTGEQSSGADELSKIFADPNFRQLPGIEKIKVLDAYDPAFKALPLKEKANAVQLGLQNTAMQPKGFWGTLWGDISNLPAAIGEAAKNPIQAGRAMYGQQREMYEKSKKEPGIAGLGYRAASYLPIAGPGAVQAGEDFRAGRYGAGAAHTLELLAPSAAKLLPKGIRLEPAVRNVYNPVEEAAVQSIEKDVPLSIGQRTGHPGLKRVEQTMESLPGSGIRASKARMATEEALAGKEKQLAARAGGQVTDPYGAGQALIQRRIRLTAQLKGKADRLYNEVRQSTAVNRQTVQTGTKTVPGANPLATLTPAGMPRQVPVYSVLETPVDLAPIRQGLAPVYDDLKRALPDARRANSPAWRSLEELMTSDKKFMNAMDFDRTLSAVKALARDGDSPYLSTQSQRLAKMTIAQGETEFQRAVQGAGSDVLGKLQAGRRLVRAYHNVDELFQDMSEEPAKFYYNLVQGGDRSLNTLRELRKIAPNELKTTGRTFLEGLIDKSTKEGGFGRSAGIAADWNRLGPETKELLFGKQLTGDLDKFMLASKRVSRIMNPSGTSSSWYALGAYGTVAHALVTAITGGFKQAALGQAALEITGAVGLPWLGSRILFSPGGAKLLTQAMTLPVRTPAWTAAATALTARVAQEAKSQQPEPKQAAAQ